MTVKKTPEGYLILSASLSRTGIYDYSAAEMRRMGVKIADRVPNNAVVKIYRDGADVFDRAALDSFALKPVTVMHPSKQVDPKTVNAELVGIVGAPVTADGTHTRTEIQLMSDRAISKYNRGMTQLSAGYTATLDMTPGRTPDGHPYDGKQTKIVGNHIAMVPAGRAGTAKLGDHADERNDSMADNDKSTQTVDAVAFGALKQQHADMTLQLDTVMKDRDRLAGEVEALKASAVTEDQRQSLIDQGIADALAARDVRDKVIAKAKKLAPAMVVRPTDTDRQIMETAIKAQRPEVILDDQSDVFVAGMFDILTPHTIEQSKGRKVPGAINTDRLRQLTGR